MAIIMVNNPDDFIRNVDLIIDVCATIDQKTGGNISEGSAKLNDKGIGLSGS